MFSSCGSNSQILHATADHWSNKRESKTISQKASLSAIPAELIRNYLALVDGGTGR